MPIWFIQICNLGIEIVIEHNNICNLHELESLSQPFLSPRRPAEPWYRAASQSRAFFIIETPYHWILQQHSSISLSPIPPFGALATSGTFFPGEASLILGCAGVAVVLVLLPTLGLHFLIPNQGVLVVLQDSVQVILNPFSALPSTQPTSNLIIKICVRTTLPTLSGVLKFF